VRTTPGLRIILFKRVDYTVHKIPEQFEIRDLNKRIQRVEMERDISLVKKLRASFFVAVVYDVFGIHRSSYKYWRQPGKPDARKVDY